MKPNDIENTGHSDNKKCLVPERHLEPTEAAAIDLFSRDIQGSVIMLNLLQFKTVADYSEYPELYSGEEIGGRDAFQKYINHTLPLLSKTGGEIIFLGEGGRYFIGPSDERWDLMMLIKQNSLQDFMQFASNTEYLKGIGHRNAAICDSRLLPLIAVDY